MRKKGSPAPVKTYVYALIDPISGLIRYIGKSESPEKRFIHHLYDHKYYGRHTFKRQWIGSLLDRGLRPKMMIIEECGGTGCEQEIFHITLARKDGLSLTNGTEGGDHYHHGPAAIEKMRAAGIERMKDPARRAISAANGRAQKGAKRSPEYCANLSLKMLGRKMNEQWRRNMSISRKGKTPPRHVAERAMAYWKTHKKNPASVEKTMLKLRGRRWQRIFVWTEQKERAVALVAEDKLANHEIAKEIGIGNSTLAWWKQQTPFMARVAEHVARDPPSPPPQKVAKPKVPYEDICRHRREAWANPELRIRSSLSKRQITQLQVDRIISGYVFGENVWDLMDEIGCTQSTFYQQLKLYGIPKRGRKWRDWAKLCR